MRAFTVGNDIYFNRGKYQPRSQESQRLWEHELTHTVRKGNQAVDNTIQRFSKVAGMSKLLDEKVSEMLAKQQLTAMLSSEMSNDISMQIGYSYKRTAEYNYHSKETQAYQKHGAMLEQEINKAKVLQEPFNQKTEVQFDQDKKVTLSPAETSWIDTWLVEHLSDVRAMAGNPDGPIKIGIKGFASSGGTPSANEAFLQARALNVKNYIINSPVLRTLKIRLISSNFVPIEFVGETEAYQGANDADDRKVEIRIGSK